VENRFIFIIPFRNTKLYIKDCAISLIQQNYKNWVAIFCDDASDDGTVENIPHDDRFIIKINHERINALLNIHKNIISLDLADDDIICILDGDDYLYRKDALNVINSLYKDDTLLTYGQYLVNGNSIGHCRAYTYEEFDNLRNLGFWASHLRTFKYKLYEELTRQDPELECYRDKNGMFYSMCCDVATMTPLLEIAGFDRIKFNEHPIYFYRTHQNNDHNINANLQKIIEDDIFKKPKFKKM
jgi:glycosyltransferase involved in cell wall biosynthesis